MKLNELVAHNAKFAIDYVHMLCDSIPDELFGRTIEGVKANHPAWVISHLNCYPDKVMFPMLGAQDRAVDCSRWVEVGNAGTECLDDPEGAIYAPKGELLAAFDDRYKAVASYFPSVDIEALMQPIEDEARAKRVPTIGAFMQFLVGQHVMMHMGQVSTWRRVKGLGSAM
ncbi:MAG: DinB family protein [Planctomycetota bacterium]